MSDLLAKIAAAQREAGERVVMEDLKEKGLDVRELILSLHAPEWTPELEALHKRIEAAKADGSISDALLNECTNPECIVCGEIVCPYHEPLHFHHDGCPACDGGCCG